MPPTRRSIPSSAGSRSAAPRPATPLRCSRSITNLSQTISALHRREAGPRIQPGRIVFRSERARVEHRWTAQPDRPSLHRFQSVGVDARRRQEHLDQDAPRFTASRHPTRRRCFAARSSRWTSCRFRSSSSRRRKMHHWASRGKSVVQGHPGAVRAARSSAHRVFVADPGRGVHRRPRVLRWCPRQPAAEGASGGRDGLHRLSG